MPQTRFVLKKALELGKKPVVVVNKIDRDGARPLEVIDELLDLFIELDADEEQLDFPVVFASGRDGYAGLTPDVREGDMRALFEAILQYVPAPEGEEDGPLQILFSNIDYDDYTGRIGIGPWFCLPDEFSVGGESLIRNLLLGHKIGKEMGGISKTGYSPFGWGQISQLPQIYAGFDIHFACLHR